MINKWNNSKQSQVYQPKPVLWGIMEYMGRMWQVECGIDKQVKIEWAHTDDWKTIEGPSMPPTPQTKDCYEVMKT